MKMKTCLIFLFIGSLCLISDCAEQKPALVSIARFLFNVGRQFVPPCRSESPKPAPSVSQEEPDFDDDEEVEKQGLALFEPSPAPEEKPLTKAEDQTTASSDVEAKPATEADDQTPPNLEDEATTEALTEAP